MTDFPINARVILQNLVSGAHLNGRAGVVKSSLNDGGRQQVFLPDEDKTVALRPSNLRYEPRDIGSMSAKEMKAVLSARSVPENEMSGVDKTELASMVRERATPEEAAEILARANAPPQSAAARTNGGASRRPGAADNLEQQLRNQADQISNMSPEQLRQQARQLRSMHPAEVRRMNPQMAGLTDQQIRAAADQMELMASNPAMMKMATEQMKNMSSEDVERVRAMQQGRMGGGSAPVQVSATAAAPAASVAAVPPMNMSEEQLKTAADQMQNMDPSQLKQQAAMIRSMRPAEVRRMNPQFAGMTDEQIQMAANQMEMMASNPEMMKMAAEQMKSMSAEDMEELRKMQSQMGAMGGGAAGAPAGTAAAAGGRGAAPGSQPALDPTTMDPSKMLESMDPAQMKKMMEILKKNPELLKQAMASNPAMAGMGEERLAQALDAFSSMDEKQLERAMGWMKRASKVSGAASATWQRADGIVGGYLKPILVCVGIFLLVSLLQRFGVVPSFAGGAAGKVASTTSAGAGIPGLQDDSEAVPVIDVQDEFESEF